MQRGVKCPIPNHCDRVSRLFCTQRVWRVSPSTTRAEPECAPGLRTIRLGTKSPDLELHEFCPQSLRTDNGLPNLPVEVQAPPSRGARAGRRSGCCPCRPASCRNGHVTGTVFITSAVDRAGRSGRRGGGSTGPTGFVQDVEMQPH